MNRFREEPTTDEEQTMREIVDLLIFCAVTGFMIFAFSLVCVATALYLFPIT